MEKIWRVILFYRDSMVKLVWRLSVVFIEKTQKVKLPDNLHINFTIKFP